MSFRICLSKARAGTKRRRALTRPAVEPAVYRSFGFGSVAAATIALATVAGSSPSSIALAITPSNDLPLRRIDRQRCVGLHGVRVEAGLGVGGLDEEHPDAVLADLVVHRLGVALDRVLGRGVDGHVRRGDEPEHGRDVDDASASLARMCGRTAFVMRMRPKKLMSKTRWSWATELSSAAPAAPMPALLTRTSIRPNRSITRSTTRADRLVAGHVEVEERHTVGAG